MLVMDVIPISLSSLTGLHLVSPDPPVPRIYFTPSQTLIYLDQFSVLLSISEVNQLFV